MTGYLAICLRSSTITRANRISGIVGPPTPDCMESSWKFITGLLQASPLLLRMIEDETAETILLRNVTSGLTPRLSDRRLGTRSSPLCA